MKCITTTGYYHTGSSAIFDLLREYENCTTGPVGEVEHIILYMPNGVFDLEDKLLRGNNIHRSDEALKSFKNEMIRLYKYNFVWFGNYKKIFGKKFMEIVDDFLNECTTFKIKGKWYYSFKLKFSFLHTIKSIYNIITKKEIYRNIIKKINYKELDNIRYSFVSSEQFYNKAKVFIYNYMKLLNQNDNKTLIVDHFLLPHNLYRINHYFEDDFRVFVIERDPRDVYVESMSQYIDKGLVQPIPLDIIDFCEYWKAIRKSENIIEDCKICRLRFEDLLYRYQDTVHRIEEFTGLKKSEHINKNIFFKPEVSIKNTQLFLKDLRWEKEVAIIEEELKDYLYDF